MTESEAKVVTAPVASRDTQLIELLATSAWITGLPVFRGERNEDVQDYIKTFEDQTAGLDDRLKTLGIRRSLSGSAREWLNVNAKEELTRNDYDALKKKILERYSGESAYLRNRQRLTAMRYDVNGRETLASFVDRFVALARRLEIKDDKEIVTGVLIALPVEVQGDLEYLENMKKLTTLSALMKLAQRYDGIESKRFKDPTNLNQLGALVSSLSQEELKKALQGIREEFQRQHEETMAAISAKSSNLKSRPDTEDRKCYNCQKVGHLARDCPEPKASRSNRGDTQATTGQSSKKDYSKVNKEALEEYEKKFGKPTSDCPICNGYHFVYHCPLKTLKE